MNKRRQSMKNKGFTILEILVVISVIAILIGIAIPRFKGMQDEANIIKAKSELRTIQAAMESYKNNYSVYATTLTSLQGATPRIIDTTVINPLVTGSDYNIDTDGSMYYVIWAPSVSGATAVMNHTSGVVSSHTNAYCVTNGSGC